MRFADIAGNGDVKSVLSGMIASGRIPHAIMLNEDDGGGAMGIVIAFLQMLYCHDRTADDSCGVCPACNKVSKLIHPDIHFIFPISGGTTCLSYIKTWRSLVIDNPSFTENDLTEALGIEKKTSVIPVTESKALLDVLSLSALEGGYRSVVVYLPEKMNQEAANRLLKMVEEPPEKTQFLFITHAPEKVLQTISSRCQHLRVLPTGSVRRQVCADADVWYSLMDALLSKNLLSSLELIEAVSGNSSRESAKGFCKFAAESLRDLFLVQQGMSGMVDISQEDRARLEGWSTRCRKNFPRMALPVVSNAQSLIDRNVNMKILFTDLVDRLYLLI